MWENGVFHLGVLTFLIYKTSELGYIVDFGWTWYLPDLHESSSHNTCTWSNQYKQEIVAGPLECQINILVQYRECFWLILSCMAETMLIGRLVIEVLLKRGIRKFGSVWLILYCCLEPF